MPNNHTVSSEKKFFGHPFQLSTLFHIELWERFSFYGMQGLLMIYLYYQVANGGLGIDQSIAGGVVGAYGGSVYLSCILGAWIADRLWGAEKTLFISGIVVMLGHIALALIPGLVGLFMGLVLISLGSGGVKSTASSIVGSLYETEEYQALRDAGFAIFYTSINIGAFLGSLLTGLLQEKIGFHYGFGLAALGMAFGLWLYSRGRKNLPKTPAPNPLQMGEGKKAIIIGFTLLGILIISIVSGLLNLSNFSSVLLYVVIIATISYFFRLLSSSHVTSNNKRYIIAYIPLFMTICVFWSLWFQFYTSVTVYFDETIHRQIGSFTIPVPWKDSLQGLFVILFSGITATMWTKMGKRQPKTPVKFSLALIIVGVSYLSFIPFITSGKAMTLTIFALVVLAITISELFLSPISLSFSTKIAPSRFKTQMVALNFLALSLGFTLGGLLFKQYQPDTAAQFYWMLCLIGVVTGCLLLILTPILNRLLQGID